MSDEERAGYEDIDWRAMPHDRLVMEFLRAQEEVRRQIGALAALAPAKRGRKPKSSASDVDEDDE